MDGYKKLYIMTINVLAPYRRRGIGQKLLDYVLDIASKDATIIESYLHVQTSNDDAKQFYMRNGFEDMGIVENYYKRIEPPHAFCLKKILKEAIPIITTTTTTTTTTVISSDEQGSEEN